MDTQPRATVVLKKPHFSTYFRCNFGTHEGILGNDLANRNQQSTEEYERDLDVGTTLWPDPFLFTINRDIMR